MSKTVALANVLFLIGLAFIVGGVAMMHVPSAMIVAGIGVIVVGIGMYLSASRAQKHGDA